MSWDDAPPPPPGLAEFREAMSEAVSSGADVWIVTKAGEHFAGELESVSSSSENRHLVGLEVTVTINGRTLLFQEIANWTVGLVGEPSDEQLDAAITQALDLLGPMTAGDLVVALTRPPAPVWCTVPRALIRLRVLEASGWVTRAGGDPERWRSADSR